MEKVLVNRRLGVLLSQAMLLCLLPALPALSSPLPVFVSILPQKYFVERIGGERVDLSVMVGAGQNPATYEPLPRQMALLTKARLYFRIGVPFEEIWMKRLAEGNPAMTVVGIPERLTMRAVDHFHGDDDGRSAGGNFDPHIWTSPRVAREVALVIRNALVEIDPAGRDIYEEGYRSLDSDLKTLDEGIEDLLRGLEGRAFVVFHPSWGYFAHTYGLRQVAIEKGGRNPGGRHLSEVIEEARREGVKAVFVQKQFSRRHAETVAREIGATVIVVDPLAEDYIENLRSIAAAFAGAMK